MKESNEALFSKPILAALMVFITLLIWVLNATAPAPRFAQPNIETWQTESSVPTIWLDQEIWQGTNKLEIRLRFNHGRADDAIPGLTDTLFALLLLDTLPLSSSAINKRLESTASQLNYHVSEDDSELAITLNSDFLVPSLKILTPWLNTPVFKTRTFARWQQNEASYSLSPKAQLTHHLYPTLNTSPLDRLMKEYSLSLEDIETHFQALQSKMDKIVVVGHIQNVKGFKTALNTLTATLIPTESTKTVERATANALHTQIGDTLQQSHGALAIDKLTTITDWIGLQIWLPHFLAQLNNQTATEYTQLHLEQSHLRQWIWWSTQHGQRLLTDSTPIDPILQDQYASKNTLLTSLGNMTEDQYNNALESLQDKIAIQSQSPTWWARMASQEITNNNGVTLEDWIKHYPQELKNIRFKHYIDSLQRLVLKDSFQEIQMRN